VDGMSVGNQQLPTHHPTPASKVASGLTIRLAKSAAIYPERRAYDRPQNTIGMIILFMMLRLASLRTCENVGRDDMRP